MLDLPREVLAALRQRFSPQNHVSRPDEWRKDVRVDLVAALRRASTNDSRLNACKRLVRVDDVMDLLRTVDGDDPANSKLVWLEFWTLERLVRNKFDSLRAAYGDGALNEPGKQVVRGTLADIASEMRQLIELNAVLYRAPVDESRKTCLLSDDESSAVGHWLDALAPKMATNEGESITYDIDDIRQLRPNACGDACVQALQSYHGRPHQRFGTNDRSILRGLLTDEAHQNLAQQGIATVHLVPTEFRRVSAGDLRRWLTQYGPLLAQCARHMVLITGLDGDKVRIHCPLLGTRQASVATLNGYLAWQKVSFPIQGTYALGPPVEEFTAQPRPGRAQRLAARTLVGGAVKITTRKWKAVKSAGTGSRVGNANSPPEASGSAGTP